jgi:para-nitrobenzyl esterase
MAMKRSLLTLLLSLIIAPAVFAADGDPVKVDQGLLAGTTGKNPDIRVYRGIPFAAPPVGDLRWQPPQPPASWQGVRDAKEYRSACWQMPYAAGSIYQATLPPLNEDCLYLNIWTAARSAKDRLPVMVWIHGGGFTRGSGASASYDGENLARKGVVLVTINYRLGIFGFMAHPELTAESEHHASGNYGLQDQVAALEWVQKNIAAFGGDPKNVTIFGESAGSWAVNALMASPLAKGLFQRVIGESGGNFSPMRSLAEAEKAGAKMDASIKALRAKPAEELLKSNEPVTRAIVDGWVLPQDVNTIFAQGKQNDVPLIVGSNADEGTSLAPQGANTKASGFTGSARQSYGALSDGFLKTYPAGTDEQAVSSFYAAYRDRTFGWEMRTWARLATKTGHHPVYLYYFSHRPPGPQRDRLRAFHASEIPYVFGNFVWQFPWEEADHRLSDVVSTYWVNFARTGNPNGASPNGSGLVRWPVYDPGKDQALEIGDTIAARAQVNKAGLDFFDSYYQSLMATAATGASTGPATTK